MTRLASPRRWHWLAVAVALAACAATPGAAARAVDRYTSDQLVAESDVVCNGVPDEIEYNGRATRLAASPEDTDPLAMLYKVARVRILGRYKGTVPEEIRVRYSVYDPHKRPEIIINGPGVVELRRGVRYRFFLRKPGPGTDGCYVGVRDGTYDDNRSVEQLNDGAPDDVPPFLRADAVRFAEAYIRKHDPRFVSRRDDTDFDYWAGDPWCSVEFAGPASPYPSYAPGASVKLDSTGKVLPRSYVAVGRPKPPGRGLSGYEGRLMRIIVDPECQHPLVMSHDILPGGYYGRLTSADGGTLRGRFAREGESRMELMTFPEGSFAYVQRLADFVEGKQP